MRVRSYLIVLIAFTALGGLLLASALIQRQTVLDDSSSAVNNAMKVHKDAQRFQDQLKQLFVSTDLLFGSAETYMIAPSVLQAEAARKLCESVYKQLGETQQLEKQVLGRVHQGIDRLLLEIQSVEAHAGEVEFSISREQLTRVDDIAYDTLNEIGVLLESVEARVEALNSSKVDDRTKFEFIWLALILAYIASVVMVLLWAAKSVSRPLTQLTHAAAQAMYEGQNFAPGSKGPQEVKELTSHIGSFVDSLQAEIQRSAAVFSAIPDTLLVFNRFDGVVKVKPGIGVSEHFPNFEGNFTRMASLIGSTQMQDISTRLIRCLDEQVAESFDLNLEVSGRVRAFEGRVSAAGRDEGIVVLRDVTEERKSESRIQHLAYHDDLTGLLKRNAFKQSVKRKLDTDPSSPFGLLFLDVDRFKTVNDTLGHEVGDAILQHITHCLTQNLRAEDGVFQFSEELGGNVAARLGGDEFVVMIADNRRQDKIEHIAKRLLNVISKPAFCHGKRVSVSASVGISIYPDHGSNVDELINHADLAMFEAKKEGGDMALTYEHAMGEKRLRTLTLEARLSNAIDNGDLFLMYQPKLDLVSGQVVGAEALVRWQEGDVVIPPFEFIPIAEESGLILPLGYFVAQTAIQQLAQWLKRGTFMREIAINVSAPQLKQSGFVEFLTSAVTEAQIDCSMVNIEVTESQLMDQYELSLAVLSRLRDAGFSIAMDDFGTGYSSLSYIKDLPLDVLKIDRAFVAGVGESEKEKAIVGSIINLGQTLDLKIVAEGVETEAQAQCLRDFGCDQVQGYLYSPPLIAKDFEAFLLSSYAEHKSGKIRSAS